MSAGDPNQARNLPNTKAYMRFREQAQASFDLAVVVCHAVPALKRQISLLEQGVIEALPSPDYFPVSGTVAELREQANGYRQRLADYTLITNFSFFEAFVRAAMTEMIDFHGGPEELRRKAEKRERRFIDQENRDVEKYRQRLRATNRVSELWGRLKNIRKLQDLNYRFPSELFSSYGIRMLLQKLGNLRAVDIPDLLVNGIHMSLDQTTIDNYHEVRNIRNRIAHGESVSLSMKELSHYNTVLRQLAIAIDQHLNRHFLIAEDTFRGN